MLHILVAGRQFRNLERRVNRTGLRGCAWAYHQRRLIDAQHDHKPALKSAERRLLLCHAVHGTETPHHFPSMQWDDTALWKEIL